MSSPVDKLPRLARLTLEACESFSEAEILRTKLPYDSAIDHAGAMLAQVSAGTARVLNVRQDGKRVGFVLYRMEQVGSISEFLILAAYADTGDESRPIHTDFPGTVAAFARDLGAKTLKFHTVRPALMQAAILNGFRVSEVVMRKDL